MGVLSLARANSAAGFVLRKQVYKNDQMVSGVGGQLKSKLRVYDISDSSIVQLQALGVALERFLVKHPRGYCDPVKLQQLLSGAFDVKQSHVIVREGDNIYFTDAVDMVKYTNPQEPDVSCPITMGVIESTALKTPCGHTFDSEAITQYFHPQTQVVPDNCPSCRGHLTFNQLQEDLHFTARVKRYQATQTYQEATADGAPVRQYNRRPVASVREEFRVLATALGMQIKGIDKNLENLPAKSRVYVVLGKTGDGKSSLINYYNGCEPIAMTKKVGRNTVTYVDFKNPLAPVGHKLACTKIPTPYMTRSGIAFCDLAGFGDTEGYFKDVVNALATKYAIGKLQVMHRVSLLITIDYGTIVKRLDLSDINKWLQRTFGEDYASQSNQHRAVHRKALVDLNISIPEDRLKVRKNEFRKYIEQYKDFNLKNFNKLPDEVTIGGILDSMNSLDNQYIMFIITKTEKTDHASIAAKLDAPEFSELGMETQTVLRFMISGNRFMICDPLIEENPIKVMEEDLEQLGRLSPLPSDTRLGVTTSDGVVTRVTDDAETLIKAIESSYFWMMDQAARNLGESGRSALEIGLPWITQMTVIIRNACNMHESAATLLESSKEVARTYYQALENTVGYRRLATDVEILDQIRPMSSTNLERLKDKIIERCRNNVLTMIVSMFGVVNSSTGIGRNISNITTTIKTLNVIPARYVALQDMLNKTDTLKDLITFFTNSVTIGGVASECHSVAMIVNIFEQITATCGDCLDEGVIADLAEKNVTIKRYVAEFVDTVKATYKARIGILLAEQQGDIVTKLENQISMLDIEIENIRTKPRNSPHDANIKKQLQQLQLDKGNRAQELKSARERAAVLHSEALAAEEERLRCEQQLRDDIAAGRKSNIGSMILSIIRELAVNSPKVALILKNPKTLALLIKESTAKIVNKAIPVVSMFFGVSGALYRWIAKGEIVEGVVELGAGIAGCFAGAGTIVAITSSILLVCNDIYKLVVAETAASKKTLGSIN